MTNSETQSEAATCAERKGRNIQIVVITGMSGSGKSTALKAFEDIGYVCVDNLPIVLLPEFLSVKETASASPTKVALVMDVREEAFLDQYKSIFKQIESAGFHLEVLFLDAQDDILIQRFSQTRRHHPLQRQGSLVDGIRLERQHLRGLREFTDRTLDTSDFNVHQLRQSIITLYSPRQHLDRLVIHLLSFGFKYGVPADANLVLDVRFLENPYFSEQLRPLDGRHESVRDFVLQREETREFLDRAVALLEFLVPRYREEGKSYLVIAIGCTGGQHRSVAIIEHLRDLFTSIDEDVIVTHRDLERKDRREHTHIIPPRPFSQA
jgi:UPF0042 nucleotide-binding protein